MYVTNAQSGAVLLFEHSEEENKMISIDQELIRIVMDRFFGKWVENANLTNSFFFHLILIFGPYFDGFSKKSCKTLKHHQKWPKWNK